MAGILTGVQLLTALPVQAATQPAVIMNQKQIEWKEKPVIIADKMYVSAADLAKLFHGAVEEKEGKTNLKIGKESFFHLPKPGEKVPKGFLPLRLVAEKIGCRIAWDGTKKTVTITPGSDQQTYDKGFMLIDSTQLSEDEIKFVQKNKENPGVHQLGNLFMVALGPKPNPGYGIEFVQNKQSWEQLFVYVRQTKPQAGRMYPQMISYPYLLGRADLPAYTTIQFIDEDTGKKLVFEQTTGK
jgi:hypothetical protein